MVKIVVNTTVISNFCLIGRLDVLRNTIGEIYMAEEVVEELKICVERGIFQLDMAQINVFSMTSDERSHFLRLNERFGKGEASCLAAASSRNFKLLTDDLDARRCAHSCC